MFANLNQFVFHLLAEYEFVTIEPLSNQCKCVKCRKILTNATQVPCGCRFCAKCVDELIADGTEVCPGNTQNCKDSNLHVTSKDYNMNRLIWNVLVKCPLKCPHEDKLKNMPEHLLVCQMKIKDDDPEKKNIMEENKNLKNENTLLTKKFQEEMEVVEEKLKISEESQESLKTEVNILREDLIISKENYENMNDDMKKLRQDSEARDQKYEALIENLKLKDESIESSNAEIKILKEDMIIKNQKIDSITNEMQKNLKLKDEQIESLNVEIKLIKKGGRLVWTIEEIEERRKNKDIVRSKYFYGRNEPYKLSLRVDLNGTQNGGLLINLLVWPDDGNDDLKWPFKANVTINIKNEEAMKSQIQELDVAKPVDLKKLSGNFGFEYCDLNEANLLLGDCITIECIID